VASISCSTVLESGISASTGRSRMPLRPCPVSMALTSLIQLGQVSENRRFLLRLGYPACGFSRLLSQEHAQVRPVLLHMTQVIQLKLQTGAITSHYQ